MRDNLKARRVGTGVAVLALFLAACGGETIESSSADPGGDSAKECGTVNLAVNPWVGFEANVRLERDDPLPVPEPGALALLAAGAAGLGLARRRSSARRRTL